MAFLLELRVLQEGLAAEMYDMYKNDNVNNCTVF